ncbi:MAG: hypothetical protein M1837_002032 [Sclerophora amabilis]|nr:MAG: hypothetical protein M1837_002032 [Sclerophora amabilis]
MSSLPYGKCQPPMSTLDMAADVQKLKSRISFVLELPPSCVEFCSIAPELFVVGTYQLEEERERSQATGQQRKGGLTLFRVKEDILSVVQQLSTPGGVLDLHFSPHDPRTLATALSTGSLCLYKLDQEPVQLTHQATFNLFPCSILVLSLAWHPHLPYQIALSLSDGSVYMIEVMKRESFGVIRNQELHKHDEQAWTLAFSRISKIEEDPPDIEPTSYCRLFSGGDDAALRSVSFNLIVSAHGSDLQDLEFHHPLRKPFGAGVTAILPIPPDPQQPDSETRSELLLTGSYDDHVRLINPTSRTVLAKSNLEGGVWRLKFLEDRNFSPYLVLASCMHVGARVLRIEDSGTEWSIKTLAEFTEHQSMCYASDLQPRASVSENPKVDPAASAGAMDAIKEAGPVRREKSYRCVSTSFYDRLLCVWDFVDTG